MSQPYVGLIIMFGGNFAPAGWQFCAGQLVPISENDTLFQLIGTTYGGDGQETFALPDLQGRVPIHTGTGPGLSTYVIGEKAGTESVTLTTQQIPAHNHPPQTSAASSNQSTPANTIFGDESVSNGNSNPLTYSPFNSGTPNQVQLPAATIALGGGSQPHENVMPVLTVSYIISMFGVFPTQN